MLLDRHRVEETSKEKRVGTSQKERSKLGKVDVFCSGTSRSHAVKEDLLERADAALLYEAAERRAAVTALSQ